MMLFRLTNKNKLILFVMVMVMALVVGMIIPFYLQALLMAIALVAYVFLVLLATKETRIKKILPLFLFFILFQDTIGKLISPYSEVVLYLDELFLLICLPALIINFFRGKTIKGKFILWFLGGIIFFGAISSYLSQTPINISIQGFFLMVKGLLYLFLFFNMTYTKDDVRIYLKWVKYFAIAVLLFSIVDLISPSSLRSVLGTGQNEDASRLGMISLQSLFIHPGIFGWFMVFIGVYSAIKYKIYKNKKLLMISCLFLFFAMLSFRFKVFLSILIILLVLYILSGVRKALALLIPVAFITTLVLIFAGDYMTGLTELTLNRYIEVDMTESARKALYVVSFLIANNKFPFGAGFGEYGGYIAQTHYSPFYYEYGMNLIYGLTPENPVWATDTYWPNILGELGYFGLVMFAALYLYFVIFLLKNHTRVSDKQLQTFVLFAAFALIQALVESAGEPVFNSSPQNVFIFITVGIALSLIKSSDLDKSIKG